MGKELRHRKAIAAHVVKICICLFGLIFVSMMGSAFAEEAGPEFYQRTKLTPIDALKEAMRIKVQPSRYKTYPGAKKIELPSPNFEGLTLEDVIKKRRSIRKYSNKPLSLDEVSQLLFAAQGISGKYYGEPLRNAPSAGALYPIEVYILVRNVEKLEPGIYHYVVLGHKLEFVKAGDFWAQLRRAAIDQEMVEDAPLTFIITSIWERITWKYGQRGHRYAYMESGHICQNIYLQAASLGLGSVCIGAFFDDSVNKLLRIDGEKESAIYLHAVGKR